MRTLLTLARRELGSLFRLPVGWIVMALFVLLTGVVFTLGLVPGVPASMRDFFQVASWLLMPVAPAISMRLFAEEHRTGTAEMLLTAPVSMVSVVMGKFLGAFGFLCCMLVPTLIFPVVLWSVSAPKPDVGAVVAGYLSLLLQGGLYLAIGTAISAWTSSQTLAYLATLFPILGLLLLGSVSTQSVPQWLTRTIAALAVSPRSADFAKGIIDTSHLVYFIVVSGFFLVVAWAGLDLRRVR